LLFLKYSVRQNLNICTKGRISVITEQDGLKHIEAPAVIVSPPGVKRVAFAHEDSVWMTLHATEETDLDKIEEIFIAKNYDEVEFLEEHKKPLLGEK